MTHSNLPRDANYISRLKGAVYEQYGIFAPDMIPAARGYYGETRRVSGDGGEYFLKPDYLPFHR